MSQNRYFWEDIFLEVLIFGVHLLLEPFPACCAEEEWGVGDYFAWRYGKAGVVRGKKRKRSGAGDGGGEVPTPAGAFTTAARAVDKVGLGKVSLTGGTSPTLRGVIEGECVRTEEGLEGVKKYFEGTFKRAKEGELNDAVAVWVGGNVEYR